MDTSPEKYTAFISYRHKPLDTAVAEELIKLIERYRIPKELRKDGKTSLGKVFRDRDELGVYHDLNEAIYPALDISDFLIVICSPDTPESDWVHLEIQRFLQTHTREQILVVHVAGTAAEAIPEEVTHIYDEKGNLVKQENPLSIYLVDHNEKAVLSSLRKQFLQIAAALMHASYESLLLQQEYRKPRKRLKHEILRLLAALLGCSYDTLEQRNKKYLYQRLLAVSMVVAAFLLVFVLVVAGKNHRISGMNREILEMNQQIQEKNQQIAHQLLQTQINESKVLTLLSSQQLEQSNRIGAVESALNALPHGDGRPYYAPAESALANALNIYSPMILDYSMTVSQDTEICTLALSEDGSHLITLDIGGVLRCFDIPSASLLWESNALTDSWEFILEKRKWLLSYDPPYEIYNTHCIKLLDVVEDPGLLIYSDFLHTYAFSLETGELLYSIPFCTEDLDSGFDTYNTAVLSPDGKYFLQYSQPDARDVGLDADGRTHYIDVYETETFRHLWGGYFDWSENWDLEYPAFSPDGTMLALPFAGPGLELLVVDARTRQAVYQEYLEPAEGDYAYDAYPVWLPGNQLLLSYQQRDTAEEMNIYLEKFESDWTRTSSGPFYINTGSSRSSAPSHYLTDTHIFYDLGKEYLYAIDQNTLKLTMKKTASLAGVCLWQDGLLAVDQDGTVYRQSHTHNTYTSYLYQPGMTIRSAVGCSGEQPVLCMVPDTAPNSVIIAATPRFQDNVLLETPPLNPDGTYGNSAQSLDFWISPSGSNVFAAHEVPGTDPVTELTVYDARTMEITRWNEIPGLDFSGLYLSDFSGFSRDETKLIFQELVYDRQTGTLTALEDGSRIYGDSGSLVDHPPFYTQPQGRPLLSAYRHPEGIIYWWTDGTDLQSEQIPYEMEFYNSRSPYTSVTSIGHNGLYVQPLFAEKDARHTDAFGIFSTEDRQWHLLETPAGKFGFPKFAIGSTAKQVAFADLDKVLRIYDYDQDAIIQSLPLPVYPDSIKQMQYIGQDRYLLIFTKTAQVHLIDLQDGKELGSYPVDVSMIPVILGNNLYLTDTRNPLRIDLESGEVSAEFENAVFVLPFRERDTVLCINDEQLLAMPVYHWEELVRMGQQWLSAARISSAE